MLTAAHQLVAVRPTHRSHPTAPLTVVAATAPLDAAHSIPSWEADLASDTLAENVEPTALEVL